MNDYESVVRTIHQRKTTKLLSSVNLPVHDLRLEVNELIEAAGRAPFHRPCDETHRQQAGGVVPWRMYAMDAATCRKLPQRFSAENAGKIPAMLAAADACILTTWLPNPTREDLAGQLYEPTLANMEHIAAASAAIQNLLLAATARGWANYWSSGGVVLRDESTFALLGIPMTQILLGALFLFPESDGESQVVGGKLRSRRPNADSWSQWVSF